MYISGILVDNYRNFNSLNIEFKEGLNVIVGPNNVGKSNLINILNYLRVLKKLESSPSNSKSDTNLFFPLDIPICF